jgi:hypothetical protein
LEDCQGFVCLDLESDGALYDAESRVDWTELWVVDVFIIWDEFPVVVVFLLSITNSDIAYLSEGESCRGLEGALAFVVELEVFHDKCIRGRTLPIWMVDLVNFLLVLLAPLDASITTKPAKVDPIDECRPQRINVICWADFLEMVDHLVVDHVPAIHLDFILLDRLEDDRDVILGGLVWRGQPAISVEVARRTDVVADGGMTDVATLDGLTSDEGDSIASEEIVPCLDILPSEARIHEGIDNRGPS